MDKLNCWEFKECGREPGGKKAGELGVCPTAEEQSLNGIHDGVNAGRSCWVVAGSMCGGKIQGSFVDKYQNCNQCDFYIRVKDEEKGGFKLLAVLLKKMRQQA